MFKKKVIIPLIVVVIVIVIAVVSMRGTGETQGISVTVEPAGRHTVVQTVTATGKIQPMTQVNISADVSAKITRLDVNEGDWVEKGTLLLQLDRERYSAAVASAEANLAAAEANGNLVKENMNKARKDHDRSQQLYQKELESEASLDSSYAAAEVEVARHQAALEQVEQARASLRQARDDLAKTTIHAPMSGTISKLNKELGEMALGSQFQEDVILEISNLQGMEALVNVDENDIVSVALGDEAEIEIDALPGRGHRDRFERQDQRPGHHRPEDRVRGQSGHHRTDRRPSPRNDGLLRDRHRCPRGLPERADPVCCRADSGPARRQRRRVGRG